MAVLAAWGPWLAGAAAAITALLIVAKFVRTLLRGARKIGHFFDDWFGEPERDGQPARPGVVARLSAVEGHIGRVWERVSQVDERVQQIDHEMHPNSGTSLRDAVDDIRAQTRSHQPTVQQTFVTPPQPPPSGEE